MTRPPTAQPAGPLLALTGERDVAVHRECKRAGFDGVLVKPVRREQLLEACRDAYPQFPQAAETRG